jgi:hypothetical protein
LLELSLEFLGIVLELTGVLVGIGLEDVSASVFSKRAIRVVPGSS